MELSTMLADVQRRIDGLQAQIARPRFCGARYAQSSGQSIPNGTTTIVDFATAVDDPLSAVTTGGFWKFTAPVAGRYLVTGQVLFTTTAAWADGKGSSLALWKNGAEAAMLDRQDIGSAAATYRRLGGSDYIVLAKNDYIDLRVVQNSGAALALHTNAAYNRIAIALLPG